MNPLPQCTLIVSTYNWPKSLELLLLSILRQSHLPNEVIIADDGSTQETGELIKKFKERFPIPLVHIWQEDNGFQKAMILNKAIAKASQEYIIQIDGDIIAHKDFIKDHLTYAEKGLYLFGARVTLLEKISTNVIANKKIDFNFFSKGLKKRFRSIRLPLLMNFIEPIDRRSEKLRGCNVSFWKKDIVEINGYNEDFKGWGMEDSELVERLHNLGIKGKRLKNIALVFHIYHKEQKKDRITINQAIEDNTSIGKIIFTENGLNKYL